MYLEQKYRTCKKCGTIGGLFFAVKRTNRPTKLNIHNVCILCKREDNRESYHRCYKLNPKKYYEQSRRYILNNIKEVNRKRRLKDRIKPSNFYLTEHIG